MTKGYYDVFRISSSFFTHPDLDLFVHHLLGQSKEINRSLASAMGAQSGLVLPSMFCWQLFTPRPGTTISLQREFGTTTLNWSLAWSLDMYPSKNTRSLLWKLFCLDYGGGFWRAGFPLRKMNSSRTNYLFICPLVYYY